MEQPKELEQPERLEQPAKAIGVIAEYNSFHGGHKFRMEEAKKRTGASWCVTAISGDFVQRGGPVVYNRYLRAKMALSCDVDLVVELPSAFTISSAEDFAVCGVALLTGLGVVEVLCFGNKNGDISRIQKVAGILVQEGGDFSSLLNLGLRNGLGWPLVRNQALLAMADKGKNFPLKREEADKLLDFPNNLLGIEYCRAILRQDSPLIPPIIRRRGQGYHGEGLKGKQASAPAIRRTLKT